MWVLAAWNRVRYTRWVNEHPTRDEVRAMVRGYRTCVTSCRLMVSATSVHTAPDSR